MQTSPHCRYYCSSQGMCFFSVLVANSLLKIQAFLLSIAYLRSTFICLCSSLDSLNFHTSKHSASCVWVFFSVSFKMSSLLPRWSLADLLKPTDTWVSVIVWCLWPLLPLLTDECLLLIYLALSICVCSPAYVSSFQCPPSTSHHISPYDSLCVVITDFELSRLLTAFLSLLLIILFVWFSLCIPCFLFSPVAFCAPYCTSLFSGPCMPLTLSLTHFAHAHHWVNHTAGLSLNLSFLPIPVHVRRDHQSTGKLI